MEVLPPGYSSIPNQAHLTRSTAVITIAIISIAINSIAIKLNCNQTQLQSNQLQSVTDSIKTQMQSNLGCNQNQLQSRLNCNQGLIAAISFNNCINLKLYIYIFYLHYTCSELDFM